MFLVLYFFIVFLAEVATDLYVPSLPILAKYFSVPAESVQKTMTFHLAGFAMGQLIYGPLLDRFGRKPILITGFGIFVFASFACSFSTSISSLISYRFIQGLGACVAPVVAISALKNQPKHSSEHLRLLTLLNMIMSLSPIIGPLLGALLIISLGWQAPFYLLGSLGLTCWILLCIKKEPTPILFSRYSFNFAVFLKSKQFMTAILSNALLVSTVWLFISEAPFVFKHHFHSSEVSFGLYQAITVIGYLGGGGVTLYLSKRIASSKLIFIGMLTLILSSCFLLGLNFQTPLSFALVFSLFEAGIGMTRPFLLNSALDLFPQQAGMASALMGCSEMVVSASIIFLMGIFSNGTLSPLITITVTSVFLISILYLTRMNFNNQSERRV